MIFAQHPLRVFLLGVAVLRFAYAQVTEAVATTSKGTFSLETDVYSWMQEKHSRDREGIHRNERLWGASMLNYGLREELDVQVGLDLWHQHESRGSSTDSRSGIGDMYLRAKWNCFGKEGQSLAFSCLPSVLIPTSRKGIGACKLHFGWLIPWSLPLAQNGSWMLAGMAGVHSEENEDGARRFPGLGTLCLTRTLNDSWASFAEVLWEYAGTGQNAPSIGAGLQYQRKRAQYVCAVYSGLGRSAPDWRLALSINLQ